MLWRGTTEALCACIQQSQLYPLLLVCIVGAAPSPALKINTDGLERNIKQYKVTQTYQSRRHVFTFDQENVLSENVLSVVPFTPSDRM